MHQQLEGACRGSGRPGAIAGAQNVTRRLQAGHGGLVQSLTGEGTAMVRSWGSEETRAAIR